MQGKILDFSVAENKGYITGQDGNRYTFQGTEWKEQKTPSRGNTVDFEITESGEAAQVFFALGAVSSNSFSSNTSASTFNEDEESYSVIDWTMKCFKNYANFNGRARRKEFWFFILGTVIISIALQVLDAVMGSTPLFSGIFSLACWIPSLAVGSRRLHDIGKSGWWQLVGLTGIGLILLGVWWGTDTLQQDNEHGEPAYRR